MPHSADDAAPAAAIDAAVAQDLALLAEAVEAHQAGRRAEAYAMWDQIGPAVRQDHRYLALSAARAGEQGGLADAIALMEEACARRRDQHGRDDTSLLLALTRAYLHRQDGASALAARNRAEAAIDMGDKAQRDLDSPQRAELRDIDAELAQLLWKEGRYDEAVEAQLRVLERAPSDLQLLRQLRAALALRDRMGEAVLVQLQIVLLQPDSAATAYDLGQLLQGAAAEAAAQAWFRRARQLLAAAEGVPPKSEPQGVAYVPLDPVVERIARSIQGMAGAPDDPIWPMAVVRSLLAQRGSPPAGASAEIWAILVRNAAIAALRRVISLQPGHAEATGELATLLLQRDEKDEEGLGLLRGALKLAPRNASLHRDLGWALRRLWRMEEAQQSFRMALALQPDDPVAMIGLAETLLSLGPDTRALPLLERAMALDPTMPAGQALAMHSLALNAHGRHEEALANYDRVLMLAPGDAGCMFNKGLSLLLLGRLEEGWPLYAWRWRDPLSGNVWRAPDDPLRRPDPAEWKGRTVLVYAEQALGDTIQFLRYARMVAACGARVLLEVHAPLKSLAAGIPDVAGVYTREEGVPPFDIAVPLMDLPWAFGTTLETIPAQVPYLRGDLERAAQFRRRMGGLPGLKVGLVWSGNPRRDMPAQAAMDRRRSLPLAALAPLAEVPGVVFVSLQLGEAAAQAATPPDGMILHDWTDELDDFTTTAALMMALDLVISVDTAPAHLAGALGREVWLLNRTDTDFRWLLGRDDSPWYPTMRQFRQTKAGVWDDVILRVAEALRERASRG